MTLAGPTLDRLAIDTIRTLSIDGVQKANSGHPGAPMGAAPMAFTLWTRFLRHAPTRPDWPDRDRFVLSAGHASMLLYSLLHLTGYDVTLEDLESFRQYGSKTPGHPEYGLTPGVEATTGPLGQGFANAVGMAIAERRLAAEFNRPGHDVVDHWTYTLCSDGDLQEGIASEAASLAGHLRLGKLVALYDDNRIQLDGPTEMAWSEDVPKRFEAYGWHAQRVEDGNDVEAIAEAIAAAREDDRPSLIAVRTHIGFGSPNRQDTQKAHGQPLGADEVRLVKEAYGWDPDKSFYVPDDALAPLPRGGAGRRGARRGVGRGVATPTRPPTRTSPRSSAAACLAGAARDGLGRRPARRTPTARRSRRGTRARTRSRRSPGRSRSCSAARRTCRESNLTVVKGGGDFEADDPGRNLRFGVREHAMGGAVERDRLPRRLHPVRRHVPDVQRLHARLRPARRAQRPPRDLRLDPRLDRAGRGRPDPPAGRALRGAPGDPQPLVRPARRRERDGGGLGGGPRSAAASRRPARSGCR